MDSAGEGALQLLFDAGLISVVGADADMKITSARGRAVAGIPVGVQLCDAVAALVGMADAVAALKKLPADERVTMANIAVMDDVAPVERRDYVVIYDAASDGFVLSITPSHAFDELSVELEQNDRREQQLLAQLAAQTQAIEETNAALRRTNADLVNFTRIISHDLKAPMRAIRYSAEDITESLTGTEDPAQILALTELRHYSVRLSQMVTDLLAYSRLEDKKDAAAPVDTRALMMSIARSLPRPPDLALEISGDWPEITTFGALLDVVLRNLLDNAIKHHDSGQGQISIAAEHSDDFLAIAFDDDGPGIPADYRQAVVRPFIKVRSDQAGSSGMGLSMVHKVMTDVGGRLDIGARLDGKRGARIVVRWPCAAR